MHVYLGIPFHGYRCQEPLCFSLLVHSLTNDEPSAPSLPGSGVRHICRITCFITSLCMVRKSGCPRHPGRITGWGSRERDEAQQDMRCEQVRGEQTGTGSVRPV